MQLALDPMSRRFNNVWISDPIDVPPDVAGGLFGEIKPLINLGRLMSLDYYKDVVYGEVERTLLQATRERDYLYVTSRKRVPVDANGNPDEMDKEIQRALIEFANRFDDLTAQIRKLTKERVHLKARYLLWDFVWPAALGDKPDPMIEGELDFPELYPILEWLMDNSVLEAVAQKTKDPKSTAGSTTISS